ncbi:MAG: alpha-hydroxy-acid oxidizing protein, partial [Pseudomonadota bacterium]
TDWTGVKSAIAALVKNVATPVIVKEVGAGIGARCARQLTGAGVAIIDVAGAGGTSWAGVEAMRAPDEQRARIAQTFRDWGIPTAQCITQVRRALPDTPIIASGGIRTGLDAARAIRLGANFVGQAASVLRAAIDSPAAVITHFQCMAHELQIACLCTGSATLAQLRCAELLETDGHSGRCVGADGGNDDRS